MIFMKIHNKKVLLDSNILIFSSNILSTKYKIAKQLRELAKNNEFRAYITHQNINETLRVLTHKNYVSPFTLTNALKQIDSFIKITAVISPNSDTLQVFLNLAKEYKITSNQIYDAYLVATAITNDIRTIATDNEKDFKKYKEIKVYNPFK